MPISKDNTTHGSSFPQKSLIKICYSAEKLKTIYLPTVQATSKLIIQKRKFENFMKRKAYPNPRTYHYYLHANSERNDSLRQVISLIN